MRPTHHPPLSLLGDHAAGNAPEGVAVVLSAHLELCPACREEAGLLDELGGETLAQLPPDPVDDSLLDGILARLDEPLPPPAPRAPLPEFLQGLPLPRVLQGYLSGARRWSLLLPGIYEIALPVDVNGLRTSLLRFAPGTVLPQHGHGGLELTLCLQGGFDSRGLAAPEVFLPGDLSVCAPGQDHEVRIHDEGCIVLFARTGRLEARTWGGALGMLLGQL